MNPPLTGYLIPFRQTLLVLVLNPLMPLNADGTLILPPMSVPIVKGTHLEAIRPASPPELPPQVLAKFQGFFASPQTLLSLCIDRQSYGVLPLTRKIAPASFIRVMVGQSSVISSSIR
jgi:hypothetical protein